MSDLLTEKQMEGQPPRCQAAKAIEHTLEQIRTEPTIGYLMGLGGQSFALLTEAFAALCGVEVSKVREKFMPRTATNPQVTYGQAKEDNDPFPGGCPCCGGGGQSEYDELRADLEDLVAQFATDVLIPTPYMADDDQLIAALREKLNRR